MNLLNNLTIKNLKLNKKRTIVTIIGIMLSVALITAVATIYSSLIKSLIDFETYQKGNFHAAFFDVPINEIETIKNNRCVKKVHLTSNIGYAKLEGSKNEYKPYIYVKGFTKDSIKELSAKLVEGRFPENENEIIIPTHLKTNGRVNLNIGETITLDVGTRMSEGSELTQDNPFSYEANEKIINTTEKTYKIVGIIERPASNIESYQAPGYTFITCVNEKDIKNKADVYCKYTKNGSKNYANVTANILGVNENTYNKFISKNYSSEEEANSLAKEVADNAKYKYNLNTYLITLENNPFDQNAVGNFGILVAIVCVIIVVTSVFCIKNSFDISITEKIKQYGMLRSIGATKKQIRKNVFFEATILGLIGIPLGLFAGMLASYILVKVTNLFLTDMLTEGLKLVLSYSWIAIIFAILLGFITIYFSALRSAFKASKVSPIDSIRNSSNIKIKAKKVKSPKIIKKIFGIGGEISYKNLKRNKKKYRTTVISIVVSVSVFIALSYFMNVAFSEIGRTIDVSDYNISLWYYISKDEQYGKIEKILQLDNINNYTISKSVSLIIDNPNFNEKYLEAQHTSKETMIENENNYYVINTLGKEQYKKYLKELNLDYNNFKDKGIIIDQIEAKYQNEKNKNVTKYLREYNYKENDTINGKYKDSEGKMSEFKIDVGLVTDKLPFGLNQNIPYIIISDELYDKLGMKSAEPYLLIDSSNPDKLQNEMEEILKDENYTINNMNENVKIMRNMYILIGIFLYGFIIVISLIGVTNIFNTINTNMNLRRQEFAMLKSVGMTSKEFSRMIRLESTFMGIKALLWGIPIGLGLSYLEYKPLVGYEGLPFEMPILAIIISIIVVYLLITILMKYSMNKINKQNTIETIRNENI